MKKGFIIGLATGLTVAGASLVLANSQIQAILNDQIKVTLNGQIQEFKDETTNETQYPITYHDRTYLPLRTVANLVGVDVDYDANINTAILTTKKADSIIDEIQVGTKKYPKINLNSADAKKVNSEIETIAKQDGFYSYIGYKYNIIDNVLSLFVKQGTDAGACPYLYYIYNFDINTGKLLKTSDLINEEKAEVIMSKIQKIYDKHYEEFKENNIEMQESSLQTYHDENIKLMPKNIDDVPYYIDSLNGPQIVLELINIAAASYEVIDINDVHI